MFYLERNMLWAQESASTLFHILLKYSQELQLQVL